MQPCAKSHPLRESGCILHTLRIVRSVCGSTEKHCSIAWMAQPSAGLMLATWLPREMSPWDCFHIPHKSVKTFQQRNPPRVPRGILMICGCLENSRYESRGLCRNCLCSVVNSFHATIATLGKWGSNGRSVAIDGWSHDFLGQPHRGDKLLSCDLTLTSVEAYFSIFSYCWQ